MTAEASRHSTHDWATVDFLTQAGVSVQWLELEKHGIRGNGHLCFLETNSDAIAGFFSSWIRNSISSTPSSGEIAVHASMSFHGGQSPCRHPSALYFEHSNTGLTDSATKAREPDPDTTSSVVAEAHTEQCTRISSFQEVSRRYHRSLSRSIADQQQARNHSGHSEQCFHIPEIFARQGPITVLGGWYTNLHTGAPDGLRGLPLIPDGPDLRLLDPESRICGLAFLNQAQVDQAYVASTFPCKTSCDTSAPTNSGVPGLSSMHGLRGFTTSNGAYQLPCWQSTTMQPLYDSVPRLAPVTGHEQASLAYETGLLPSAHEKSKQYDRQPTSPYPFSQIQAQYQQQSLVMEVLSHRVKSKSHGMS